VAVEEETLISDVFYPFFRNEFNRDYLSRSIYESPPALCPNDHTVPKRVLTPPHVALFPRTWSRGTLA